MKKLTEQRLRRIIRKEIMEQQRVDEGFFTIALSVAAGIFVFRIALNVLKVFISMIGFDVEVPKNKLLKINKIVWDKVRDEAISTSTNAIEIVEIEAMRREFIKKIKSGEITTIRQITDILKKMAKK